MVGTRKTAGSFAPAPTTLSTTSLHATFL
jgi:hypothetical protein